MSDKEKPRNYIRSSITGLVFLGFVSLFWLGFVSLFWDDIWPWDFLSVWEIKTPFTAWLADGWPLLVWGVGLSALINFIKPDNLARRIAIRQANVRVIFTIGFWSSVRAGIFEELAFRWILPYAAVPTLLLMNWLFFGWLGWGFNEWLHTTLWSPLANWTTFGYLQPQLLADNWVIGACILYSNTFFRDGHKYQGPIGWINSWFAGMYLWYICLTHGLLAAIVVHLLYDVLIDVYIAVYLWVKKYIG